VLRGAAGTLASAWSWRSGCKYDTHSPAARRADRREAEPEWAESRVRQYRPLGHTQFQMSDISFGCGGLSDPGWRGAALNAASTLLRHVADYSDAASSVALDEGIRGTPRDKLFLVSKLLHAGWPPAKRHAVPDVVKAVEASLQRLGTDYLDLVHIHAVNSIDRLMRRTFTKDSPLKQAGKVRYTSACTSHTRSSTP